MKRLSALVPALAAVFGLMLTVGAVFSAYQYLMTQEANQFESESGQMRDYVQHQLDAAETALEGFEALAYASREMTASKLSLVAKQQMSATSSINAMFYAPFVAQDEREYFEQMMQEEGYATFAIKQNESMPAAVKAFYFPITLIEPFEVDDVWLIGLDLAGLDAVGQSIDEAITTSKSTPVFTGFYQNDAGIHDLWLLKALYAGHSRVSKDANGLIGMRISLTKMFSDVPVPKGASLDIMMNTASGESVQLRRGHPMSSGVASTFYKLHAIPFGEDTLIISVSRTLSWTHPIFLILFVGLMLGLLATVALVLTVKALLESDARQRAILDSALDGIITMDERGVIQAFNPAAERMFAYREQEIIGRNFAELIVAESGADWLAAYVAAHEMHEIEAIRANGEVFQVEMTLSGVYLKGHSFFTAFLYDISKRKLAEEKANQLAAVVEQAELVVILTDCDGVIEYVNPAFEKLSGYSAGEAIGRSPSMVKSDQHSTEYYQEMWQALLDGEGWVGEFVNKSKSGTIYEVMQTVFPIFEPESKLITGFASIQRDITESKRLEQQTEHAQRLESLGVMAGGIAHDFNNLLAAIMGNAGLALSKTDEDDPTRRYLHNINKASESAALLCKQMLAYSGQGQFVLASINLSTMIQDVTELLNTSISKMAELGLSLEEGLPRIKGDPGQIQQVIMNLVINASEALEDAAGHISVSTKQVVLSKKDVTAMQGNDLMQAGEYVVLTVRDTGCGMDIETQQKMFEPFFTTKFTGRGLGMSALLGIVRAHHGGIKITSHVGQGSEFKVYLPVCEAPELMTGSHSSTSIGAAINVSGTVLIVDDEESVREMCVEILSDKNLSTLAACDGEECVRIFREQHENIALVILDMTMPKMGGAETYRHLREISSDVRVIVSSGYAEEDVAKQFEGQDVFGYVQKPYAPEMLIKKVAEALAEPV